MVTGHGLRYKYIHLSLACTLAPPSPPVEHDMIVSLCSRASLSLHHICNQVLYSITLPSVPSKSKVHYRELPALVVSIRQLQRTTPLRTPQRSCPLDFILPSYTWWHSPCATSLSSAMSSPASCPPVSGSLSDLKANSKPLCTRLMSSSIPGRRERRRGEDARPERSAKVELRAEGESWADRVDNDTSNTGRFPRYHASLEPKGGGRKWKEKEKGKGGGKVQGKAQGGMRRVGKLESGKGARKG